MLTRKMASLLACPTCHADVKIVSDVVTPDGILEGTISCLSAQCGAAFPVHNGIPDLVPGHLLDQDAWRFWKDHLDGFQKRRDLRIVDADRLASRMVQKRKGVQQAFGRFTAITRGAVLDVGCGPGKLRFNFDPGTVDYFGIDPTPLPEAAEFPYAKALAEYLPFRDGAFTDVVVVSALDHFRDCTQFFNESARVLQPGGRLHVVQTIHKPKNPIKRITHWVKDTLEDHATRDVKGDAPHHMWEFSRSSFMDTMSRSLFRIVSQTEYSRNWYSPDKVFLTMAADREAVSQ